MQKHTLTCVRALLFCQSSKWFPGHRKGGKIIIALLLKSATADGWSHPAADRAIEIIQANCAQIEARLKA
jgi:hypothetical protein